MNYQDVTEAKRKIYGLAHNIGQTGPEQDRIIRELQSIEANSGGTDKEILVYMLNRLVKELVC